MANKKTRICIILPAFNEAGVITDVLKKIPKTVATKSGNMLIFPLVIDDGSSDATAKTARKVRGVTVLQHPINMGAGAATRTGLHYARKQGFDYAVTMDADGQHAASDVIKLIKAMVRAVDTDILIGSRLQDKGNMPAHKKIGNHLLSFGTFLMFGVYVSDSQSGLKVFSPRALEKLEFNSNGYVFCSEMLWQAQRAGLKIAEHPIRAIYTNYSKAKGQKSYSGGIRIVQDLLIRRVMELIA
jgi:glycosyltransferase involved in cell wall biosynthesis